jgi:hypothetical protein
MTRALFCKENKPLLNLGLCVPAATIGAMSDVQFMRLALVKNGKIIGRNAVEF